MITSSTRKPIGFISLHISKLDKNMRDPHAKLGIWVATWSKSSSSPIMQTLSFDLFKLKFQIKGELTFVQNNVQFKGLSLLCLFKWLIWLCKKNQESSVDQN